MMSGSELADLHGKILEIAEYFDSFCRENGIIYYLMGGSALGAIRHNGFIPWDDDFDVFMDYENYSKFLEVVKGKLDTGKYYFQKEDTEEWPLFFSKIRMNNTTFIEKDVVSRKMHHGIYIDIMCLNATYDSVVLRWFQYISARILSAGGLSRKGYITNSLVKRVMLFISGNLVIGPVKSLLLKFVRRRGSGSPCLVGHFFGRAPFKRTSFPYNYLGGQRYVPFQGIELPVPSGVEKYLTLRYGENFMSLPSDAEKAKYPSHALIVDTKNSYEKYMNCIY